MKTKLILESMLLLITLSSSAQITINRNDIVNLTGVTLIYANDFSNLNALSPGNAGANQTWNLSAIKNDEQDSTKFPNPIGLLCSDFFSNSKFSI